MTNEFAPFEIQKRGKMSVTNKSENKKGKVGQQDCKKARYGSFAKESRERYEELTSKLSMKGRTSKLGN